jgi:hypothetical protein
MAQEIHCRAVSALGQKATCVFTPESGHVRCNYGCAPRTNSGPFVHKTLVKFIVCLGYWLTPTDEISA